MIDFHSHILHGIDDGSSSVEESIGMLRLEAEQGIRDVFLTPHFYPRYNTPEAFLEKRAKAEKELRAAMAKEEGLPRLHIGAEVYFFRGMSDSEFTRELAFEGGKYILVEMPGGLWTDAMLEELVLIRQKLGIIPIVAHIDRYIAPFHTHGLPKKLEAMPVIVQANAEFFLQKKTERLALGMLKKGQIQIIGSDAHNLGERQPNLGMAASLIRKKLGRNALLQLKENGRRLLPSIYNM